MALVSYTDYSDATDRIGDADADALTAARERTRQMAYGDITGAVFPIKVGPGEEDKAWYQVIGLRPLRLSWLPFTSFQVDPDALAEVTKATIYRLIEADI